MVEDGISPGRKPACVTRNNLSQLVHTSARGAETGTGAASAVEAADPPLAAFEYPRALSRADRRCRLHPRTASRSRRSRRSRSLGRRFVARGRQQSRGHAGGASFALLHVGEDTGQGVVYGGGRSEPARGPTPGGVASLTDLGPRTGDGPTQNLHDGHGYAGLLLRSAESLAAWLKRKYQRPTAAISAKER